MSKEIQSIVDFACPRWDQLPNQPMLSSQVVAYIQEVLSPIAINDQLITSTMIQNYAKWGALPKIEGRKYGRAQIAILIIIAIYKQVLNIDQVKSGLDLQLKRMPIEPAYNRFAESITSACQRIFGPVQGKSTYRVETIEIDQKTEGIQLVSHAYACKLLATLIIEAGGYQELGEKND